MGYEEWVQALTEAPVATQAGGHPDFTTSFQLLDTSADPGGAIKDVFADLPAGAVGNPRAVPPCKSADLNLTLLGRCPTESQVGLAATDVSTLATLSPLSALDPLPGEPFLFAFKAFGVSILLHVRIRTESDYGLTVEVRNAATSLVLTGTALTLWGVPHDPIHDSHRFDADLGELGAAASGPVIPLISSPTNCESAPLHTTLGVRTWGNPDDWIGQGVTSAAQTGCEQLAFDPEVAAAPTTNVADSPTGLDVDVHVPQNNRCEARPPDHCGLATSHLKDSRITLPEGMALNPSAANGLAGCSAAEIGLITPPGVEPIGFSGNPATCPNASKIGSAEVDTPLLDAPMPGTVYLAEPYDNPFRSMFAIYLVLDDAERGVVATLAGHVVADPRTGQLVANFADGPQLPIEHIKIRLKQGPHAPLRTPPSCGDYSTIAELTPYSAPTVPVTVSDTWSVDAGANGSCDRPGGLSFDAGTIRPIAGVYSPFVLHLKRGDGAQELESLTLRLPPGLVANVKDIPLCPEIALATQVAGPPGDRDQLRDTPPLCPAASRVGSDIIGVGSGPKPFFLDEGPIFLAGPYRGAPFSFVIVVPARAGPFNLGSVVVRAALFIDPRTARARVIVDPLPQVLEGVPLSYRALHLFLDRPGFIRNPTSCLPMKMFAAATAHAGDVEELSSRFQVADCAALPFRPAFALHLSGGLARNGHPAARAVLKMGPGQAALSHAALTMPLNELLDESQVRRVCTRADYAAGRGRGELCPAESIYGHVKAYTPLLDQPLSGPVFLRSNGGERDLPDLVASLRGPIDVDLIGHVDSAHGRLRNVFTGVPDVPLTKLVLRMAGGRRGLLVNTTDLCRAKPRVRATFRAHNGRVRHVRGRVKLNCGAAERTHRHHRRPGAG